MFNLGVSAMKKSLIALAAVAASGLAMAQSSVTLYGVADIAIGDANDTQGAHANSNINNGTSRIGFRGVEDLGNGLKVNFQFEQGVSLADGASSGFQRQAWVGLAGGFGTLRAGRQLTPSFDSVAAYEITGTANYSAVALNFGYGGGSRDNAMIKYVTPSFGGLKASVGYVFEDNYKLGSYTDTKGHYDVALIYANGPLAVAAGYNAAEVATGWGQRSRVENANVGASYDFGALKLAASYHYNDVAAGGYMGGPNTGSTKVVPGVEGYSLGVSLPLGAFSLAADAVYAEDRNGTRDGIDFVVEGKYALSKRTFVYGAYYRADKEGPAYGKHFSDENNFGIGLRHNF
ncbi:porin [Comamonadaceae bacterium OH2310_COT-174]|uniref:Porin domain-containing protein n=2 Tax=Vandammella animalimorsus TaxID=2029117 RepID=A0A2A2ACB0_9BURK|nr:hypothetical protein CK620_06270 [Vandammella animalimorsus]RRD68434.1 porin [Comamonadaceae bacterium OH2310_COT-174]